MQRLNKTGLSLALALVVILTTILPVTATAAENPGGWYDLLSVSSVQTNGENWFVMNGKQGTFTIPLYSEKRLSKVDILIRHESAYRFTAASVSAGSATKSLTVLALGDGLTRIYGNLPSAWYEFLAVNLTQAGTGRITCEVLSCRVTTFAATDFKATGFMFRDDDVNDKITCPGSYMVEGGGADLTVPWQTPIQITDWQKFDTVTVFGSMSGIGLNSVRCSLGAKGLPFEITYTSTNPTGTGETYTETVSITHYETTDRYYGEIRGTHDTNFSYLGKVLFTITIDLTGVDRTDTNSLVVYFTGVTYDLHAHAFNCQNLSGSVVTPDTSGVTWWGRFTAFFTDLLGGNSEAGDQYADQMQEQSQEMQDAVQDMEAVTRPAVDDIQVDIGGYVDSDSMTAVSNMVGGFFGNPLVMSMVMVSLVVSLAAYVIFGKH